MLYLPVCRVQAVTRLLDEQLPGVRRCETQGFHRGVAGSRHTFHPLPQGTDKLKLQVTFTKDGQRRSEIVEITWDDCFRVIGPPMFQTLLRRGYRGGYEFEKELNLIVKERLGMAGLPTVQPKVKPADIDAFLFQFKQLGLIYMTNKNDFSWWTLTPKGEEHLTALLVVPKLGTA